MTPGEFPQFPQYLHRPYRFLWFEKDEIYLMIGLYALAMVYTLKIFLLLPVLVYFYRREKKRWPRGFFRHVGYRLGIFSLDGYPDGLAARFCE